MSIRSYAKPRDTLKYMACILLLVSIRSLFVYKQETGYVDRIMQTKQWRVADLRRAVRGSTTTVYAKIQGTVRCEDPMTSRVGGVPCCVEHILVETECYSTDNPNSQYWTALENLHRRSVPFEIDDGTGRILVRPDGIRFRRIPMETQSIVTGTQPWFHEHTDDSRHRLSEYVLRPGQRVLIVGQVQRGDDGSPELVIGRPASIGATKSSDEFLVTDKDERELAHTVGSDTNNRILLGIGLVAGLGALICIFYWLRIPHILPGSPGGIPGPETALKPQPRSSGIWANWGTNEVPAYRPNESPRPPGEG